MNLFCDKCPRKGLLAVCLIREDVKNYPHLLDQCPCQTCLVLSKCTRMCKERNETILKIKESITIGIVQFRGL